MTVNEHSTWLTTNINDKGLFVSTTEALEFLHLYKAEIDDCIIKLTSIMESITNKPCTPQVCRHKDYSAAHILYREKEEIASQLFCSLKLRIVDFMSKYRGISFK